MSDLVVENIRLKELILVVNKNKPFFDEFVQFIKKHGYGDVLGFVSETKDEKMEKVLSDYFDKDFKHCLYDGIARPYNQSKSKWYFITWLLRDAPQQRLQPIVTSLGDGTTTNKRKRTGGRCCVLCKKQLDICLAHCQSSVSCHVIQGWTYLVPCTTS